MLWWCCVGGVSDASAEMLILSNEAFALFTANWFLIDDYVVVVMGRPCSTGPFC